MGGGSPENRFANCSRRCPAGSAREDAQKASRQSDEDERTEHGKTDHQDVTRADCVTDEKEQLLDAQEDEVRLTSRSGAPDYRDGIMIMPLSCGPVRRDLCLVEDQDLIIRSSRLVVCEAQYGRARSLGFFSLVNQVQYVCLREFCCEVRIG
jgi:hypothetical protein